MKQLICTLKEILVEIEHLKNTILLYVSTVYFRECELNYAYDMVWKNQ